MNKTSNWFSCRVNVAIIWLMNSVWFVKFSLQRPLLFFFVFWIFDYFVYGIDGRLRVIYALWSIWLEAYFRLVKSFLKLFSEATWSVNFWLKNNRFTENSIILMVLLLWKALVYTRFRWINYFILLLLPSSVVCAMAL